MRFARWVFLLAGITGVLMVVPPYFLEKRFGQDNPPPVTHPEFYYGFFGVTLAWQLMFLVIGSDPIRFRRAMLPAMVEKASFSLAIPMLYALERVSVMWVGFAAMDATWLVLFIIAYVRTTEPVGP
jgi:hypothetical protein